MKKIICSFLVLLLIGGLFGCQSEKQEYSEVSEISISSQPEVESELPSSEPSSAPEEIYQGPFNPLTGEPITEDLLLKRPYAVMINNHQVAQPQHGISQADLLFELPVEGGITRMMAVFQDVSDVGVIGSIRSSRHDYIDLVEWLDAIYIHAGGSPYAYDAIYGRGIANVDGVNGNGEIFYRDDDRRYSMGYEHSLMTTGAEILRCVPTYGYRMEHNEDYGGTGLSFEETPALVNAQAAETCEIHFSGGKSTSFAYDSGRGIYMASQYGGPYLDGNTGEQVGFSNVIAIFTDMYVMDDAGCMEISMNSYGEALYFCGGQCSSISWSKDDATMPYIFTYEDGTPVNLKTGTTYIGILSNTQWVDY